MDNITDTEKQNLDKLSKVISVQINDYNIYKEALTHRSYVNELKTENRKQNERLEFLGDAVLELVVSEFLFKKFSTYKEGELTSFRSALVKTESLAEESLRLDYGSYLYMSRGEEQTGGRNRPYILANTFEAIIGAIYLDNGAQGYELCRKFIEKNICYKIDEIVEQRKDIDAKTKLQELSQEETKFTPRYELTSSTGPDHNKIFEMAVFIGEDEFGRGKGKSKQEAEQMAASEALKNWKK